MSEIQPAQFTAFDGVRRVLTGSRAEILRWLKRRQDATTGGPILVFDDYSGRTVDFDLRAVSMESEPSVVQADALVAPPSRGRGRPKLGVMAREITLLPRHWDWLKSQPGGASVVLRKLVEAASRLPQDREAARRRQEAAFHFTSALAGDWPGFEEALRALFASDAEGFARRIAAWPQDVREHALRLACGAAGAERTPISPGSSRD
jgi:hypothetical protein